MIGTYEFGASASAKAYTSDLFKLYAENNVKFMEISPLYNMKGINYVQSVLDAMNFAEMKNYADSFGVNLWSFHLPFDHYEVNPASLDESVRLQTIELDKRIIESGYKMGIKVMVFHASGEPIKDNDRKKAFESAIKSINELNRTANDFGLTFAVENLPRTCLGKDSLEMKILTDNSTPVKICFDVNHLLKESHANFIENVGSQIATLHISDYDFIDERHWVPGTGKINWKELIELLRKAGYTGPFMNEVSFKTEDNSNLVTLAELKNANEKLLDNA